MWMPADGSGKGHQCMSLEAGLPLENEANIPKLTDADDIQAYFEGLVGTFSVLKEQYMFQLAP